MDRLVDRRIVPAIIETRSLIHSAIWQRIQRADFSCGVDPNFVGERLRLCTVTGQRSGSGKRGYCERSKALF